MNLATIRQATRIAEIRWLPELDSTNSFAIRELHSFHELPILIGTNKQTGGRGRGKNSWWAGDGALTFSLVLKPGEMGVPQSVWPILSLIVGLSVCEGLEQVTPELSFLIKWPNDVYLRQKKICGILIETVSQQADTLVVGVGINVNNSLAEAPPEIQERATSLVDCVSQEYVHAEAVLLNVLNALFANLDTLAQSPTALMAGWKRRCYLTSKLVTIENGQDQLTGFCLGVDEDGALRLRTELGETRFFGGTITQIADVGGPDPHAYRSV